MLVAILAAHNRIGGLVRETPVEYSPELGAWLKLEHLQTTGSFKFRGACNKVAMLTPEQAAAGVVTASNGNHGLGVAAAARARGIAAEVFVSSHVSPGKAKRIEAHGAVLQRAGDDPLTAELAARRAAGESGRVFISPYNDADVMAGQGTIAVELLRQMPEVGSVFVAVGGGGLIGGIGAYVKAVQPKVEVVGCWPENSPVMWECMRAGRVVEVAEQPTLSESTAGGLEPGSVTLDVCRKVIDRAVFVTEDEIRDAMRLVLRTEHWLVEGAAAVAVAAFRKAGGRNAAIVLCGRNLSAEAFNLVF
jgi:threonine dehydratase